MLQKLIVIIIVGMLYTVPQQLVYSQNNTDVTIEDVGQESDEILPDQQPEFPGGEKALFDFIKKNIIYPELAKSNGVSGKVYVQFYVDTDGSVKQTKVLRGIGSGCDEEAVRVIKLMPKWKPGMIKDQPVGCKFVIPINFLLK